MPPSAMEWSAFLSLDPSERLDGYVVLQREASTQVEQVQGPVCSWWVLRCRVCYRLTMQDADAVRAGLAAALKPTFGDLEDDDIDPVWQVATLMNVDKDGQVVLCPDDAGACLLLSVRTRKTHTGFCSPSLSELASTCCGLPGCHGGRGR